MKMIGEKMMRVEQNYLLLDSSEKIDLNQVKKSEIAIESVPKSGSSTFLNATANALCNSLGNGEEFVRLHLVLTFDDGKKDIVYNETPFVRFSLDYHDGVRKLREMEAKIKKR